MPVALITGAARANSIAAGIVPHLISDGWEVVTSDLQDVDYACDLSSLTGPNVVNPGPIDTGWMSDDSEPR